jgi:hypothetical protein
MTAPTQYEPPTPDRLVADYVATMVNDPAVAGVALPTDWKRGSAPALVVFDDGGSYTWPIILDTRLRITVWASTRTAARGMAAWATGLLMAHSVPGIAQLKDPSTIVDSIDSKNMGNMASFTIGARARLRPVDDARYVP